jgi:hypothetical protein
MRIAPSKTIEDEDDDEDEHDGITPRSVICHLSFLPLAAYHNPDF